MKEIMGGLWFAGLLAGALLGIMPAAIFFILGAGAGAVELIKEHRAEQLAQSWRKTYPPYRY